MFSRMIRPPIKRVNDLLVNLVLANSSVCKCTQDEMYGAAVSSTEVLFRFRCTNCDGPSPRSISG